MITCNLRATSAAHCAQTQYHSHLCNASPGPPTWHRKAASSLDERQDATHPAPAACASGPRGRIRRRTHQTVSVAVALTIQSDPHRVYNSDWRSVPLRLQSPEVCECNGRSMCHRNGWPGSDWCAMDIATAREQTSHVVWEIKRYEWSAKFF